MKRFYLAATLVMLTAPAYADTDNGVTLVIENDAGSVITLPDMTRRECDAAVGLLSARKSAPAVFTLNNMAIAGSYYPPSPHTSVVTSAKCMTPTEKK